MFKKNSSEVWNHFKRDESCEKAVCKYCSANIGCKGSSTSGLIRHLSAVHPEKAIKRKENEANLEASPASSKISKIQPTIFNYIKRQSMAEIVARLCALDGFSISGVCNSSFIRESLNARGFQLPKNKTNVMKLVHDYYELVKLETIKRINLYKKENSLLSLTLDEWTSFKNRRYLNINVHYSNGSYDNLGLIRIYGNCSAEVLKNLLLQKLSSFKINLSDVLAVTTDGASVMKKFGRESSFMVHQLCLNHGIQLAICDIIYKKKIAKSKISDSDDNFVEFSSAEESDEDLDLENYEDNESVQVEEDADAEFELPESTEIILEEQGDFKIALNNVRKIVKLFKKSAVKNCVLQKYVKNEHGKELNLMLDSQTRWNSIAPMLERYLLLKSCIKKALINLNSPVKLYENEIDKLEELLSVLKPVQLAVEALGTRDCNLVTSEGIIKFLFNSIRDLPGTLATNLLEALQNRLSERRSKDLISLAMFLQNPENLKSDTNNCDLNSYGQFFAVSSITAVSKLAKDLVIQYFSDDREIAIDNDSDLCETINVPTTSDTTLPSPSTTNDLLKKSLASEISKSQKTMEVVKPDKTTSIQKEMRLYAATGTMTHTLKKIYNSVMTIKPTSTEPERVFSISGTFVTKKRVGLSDHSIDVLCFLKTYFKKPEQV